MKRTIKLLVKSFIVSLVSILVGRGIDECFATI